MLKYLYIIVSRDPKIYPSIPAHNPVNSLSPALQLLLASAFKIIIILPQPAPPLATVLGQCRDVQVHLLQLHPFHSGLHGPHQRPGLHTAQSLSPDIQPLTLETAQEADDVKVTNIPDKNIRCHTGGK